MNKRTASQDQWLEFWNRVVYNFMAPVYNSLDWLTFGAWWRLVRRALDYVPPGKRTLEIAFGPGKLHTQLARQTDQLTGLDFAWGMCRYTKNRLKSHNLESVITRGSVFELPYPTGAFDVVVSTFAFSGFPNAPDAMREMVRVLAPGGHLVLVDIALPSDSNRVGTFWARLWEKMGDFLYDQPALMQDAGLTVTTCQEFGPGNHIRAVVGEKP